jgi:hypothetical protein
VRPPPVIEESALQSGRCGVPLLKKREKWGTLLFWSGFGLAITNRA